jgi:hypothetical protein
MFGSRAVGRDVDDVTAFDERAQQDVAQGRIILND